MEKPKIALIELYDHYEVLRDFVRVINVAEFELSAFVHEKYRSEKDATQKIGQWNYLSENDVLKGGRLKDTLQAYDLVIVTTLASHYAWWGKTLQGIKYCLILHNIDPLLRPLHFKHNLLDVKNMIRRIRSLFLIGVKRNIIRNSHGVGFLSEVVLSRARQVVEGNINWIDVAPIRSQMAKGARHEFGDDRSIVIVPTTVRKSGRDYDILHQALSAVDDLSRIRLVFLGWGGTSYAAKILQRFRQFSLKGLEIVSFSESMTMDKYDEYFRSADLVVCPFSPYQQVGPYRSVLGSDMCSGVMQDLVRYGKLAAIPSSYPTDTVLKAYTRKYNSVTDLTSLIRGCVNGKMKGLVRDDNLMTQEDQTNNMTNWLNTLVNSE